MRLRESSGRHHIGRQMGPLGAIADENIRAPRMPTYKRAGRFTKRNHDRGIIVDNDRMWLICTAPAPAAQLGLDFVEVGITARQGG